LIQDNTEAAFGAVAAAPTTLAWLLSIIASISIFSSFALLVNWYASSVRLPALFTASSVALIITSFLLI